MSVMAIGSRVPMARSARPVGSARGAVGVGPVGGPGSVGLRLTRRGRVVVAVLAMIGATYVTLASQQAFAGSGGGAVPVATRTVVAGETLWQIAGDYAEPGQDVRDVVAELMDLNELPDGGLQAGQELLVPVP